MPGTDHRPVTGAEKTVTVFTHTEAENVARNGTRKVLDEAAVRAYWRANLALLAKLLLVWFVISFGCGILFVDLLNEIQVFGFKLGFWFAQQGAIYGFVILIFVYVVRMKRIERAFGVDDD